MEAERDETLETEPRKKTLDFSNHSNREVHVQTDQ